VADGTQEIADLLAHVYRHRDPTAVRDRVDATVDEARQYGLTAGEIQELLRSWSVQFPRRRDDWISIDAALADIRRLLLGPQSRGAKTWHRMHRLAGKAIEHYGATAGLIAVIGTTFYGLAYARFYDGLNITPEQAGLTPAQILTHSAAGGMALIVLIATAVFCTLLPVVAVRDDHSAEAARGSWGEFWSNCLLTAAGIGLMFLLAALIGAPTDMPVGFSGIALVLLLGFSFRPSRDGWRSHGLEPRPLRFEGDRYLTVCLAAALPVGLLLTGYETFTHAEYLSARVGRGQAVRDPKIAGLPFLGVRAEPALVSWSSGRPPGSDIPHCIFYLGGADGDAAFYDHRSDSTFRVPADDFSLELRGGITSCEVPVNLHLPTARPRADGDLVCTRGRWESFLRPRYYFDWTAEGETIQSQDPKRKSRVLDQKAAEHHHGVHCRVTAENHLGLDFAVSRAISLSPK
jgi:hypothetical protein